MRRDFVLFVIIFVIFLILIQVVMLISPNNTNLFSAKATSSSFSFCINYPPEIDLNNCPSEINQTTSIEDNTLSCIVNISHPLNHSVFIEPYTIQEKELFFSINESGKLILRGNQSAVGLQSFLIRAYADHGGCSFSSHKLYVVNIIDINDPPHTTGIIPDVELWEGTERSPFSLNEYFDDVDVIHEWKTLTYEAFPADGQGKINVEVIIDPDTTIVTFRSPSGNCETDEIFMKATDLGNLSVSSNVFKVESLCLERVDVPQPSREGIFETCEPEWKCDVWSECYPNGTQVRTCTDINRCNLENFMREAWRDCEYDAPERPEIEEIIDPEATCFDGIRNCHVMEDGYILCEEGVDCGGPCDPCERLETPGVVRIEESDNFIFVLATIVVFVTLFVIVYLTYKRKIASMFATLGWWLTRKKRKQFLLKNEDKLKLLNEINKLYDSTYNTDNIYFNRKSKELRNAVNLARSYISNAFKINSGFEHKDAKKSIGKKVLNESLKKGLYSYSESILYKEKKTVKLSKKELLCFIQETRMLVMITSKLNKNDFNFKAKELDSVSGKVDKSLDLIHNSFLALCFSEVVSAQNNYLKLLKIYDEMNDKEKAIVYREISKIYNYTKTVLSWV